MSDIWLFVILLATIVCVLIPVVGIRMLVPSLESSPAIALNYRGREVHKGLGIVWLFWVGGILLLLVGTDTKVSVGRLTIGLSTLEGDVYFVWKTLVLAGVMAMMTFAFGMIDDFFGDDSIKGFRGHLRELWRGRLSTGGLKLIGIGLTSLLVGVIISVEVSCGVARTLLATLAIAMSANFVNLMDLRPGRALKAYIAMLFVACGSIPFVWEPPASPDAIGGTLMLLIAFIGPVLAVWHYDLNEQGMLGDAGANPAGAVIGVLCAIWWPLWALAIYVLLIASLNFSSERISFSSVIERSTFLSWLDGLGRIEYDGDAGGDRTV